MTGRYRAVPGPGRNAVPSLKTAVPGAPRTLLSRPRLLAGVVPADNGDTRITLVRGPAGAGKTTLLADWVQRREPDPDTAVGWVSLGPEDNDVFVLWSAVLRALELSGAWAGTSALHRLGAPRGRPDESFSAAVDAAFEDAAPATVVLVLDDVHELGAPDALAALDLLLRRPPPGLRLVLSGRYMPPLALPKLRLEGRVHQIDADGLGFTAQEADELLRIHDIRLSGDDLAKLLSRTEGWAAGLRLAAMSLAGAPDPSELITHFAGDDRAVADYLVGEVLARQPAHLHDFLTATCVCESLTPDLARVLSGREDAGALLGELERTSSFVSRHGSAWYRYHPMLREYLLADLRRHRHGAAGRLHGAAARWFQARGETLGAIEHAAEAGDADLLATLLGDHGLRHITSGEGTRVRRALARAGDATATSATVALISAAAALDAQDPASAAGSLARWSGTPGGNAPGGAGPSSAATEALTAAAAMQRSRQFSQPAEALHLLRRNGTGTGMPDIDLLSHLERGTTRFWLGHVGAAERELSQALAVARAERRDWTAMQCLSALAGVALAAADLATAETRAVETLTFADSRGWLAAPPCTHARLVLGWLAYHALDNESAEAYAAATAGSAAAEQREPSATISPLLLDAFARFERAADRHAVVAEIRELWHRRWSGHLQPQLVAVASVIEQRMALDVGAGTWAADVADRAAGLLGETADVLLLRAVAQVQRGRPRPARQLVAAVLAGSVPTLSPMTTVEAWVWEARLAHRSGETHRANAAVAEAVALAAPRGLVRPLLHGGQEVADLLSGTVGTHGRHETYAERVRCLLKTEDVSGDSMLTTRELELLTELPSLRTADEIASSMYLSVNTVKTHIRGIYRKLGVNNRRDAVLLARRRGLL